MKKTVCLYYISSWSIIFVEEEKNEESNDLCTSVWIFEPHTKIRKRLTKSYVNLILLRSYNSFAYTGIYFNKHKQTLLTRGDVKELVQRKQGWRKIDRLGNPQILIYE